MSKICFVTMGNLYLCPYLESYTKHLDVEYDVVYWDRDNIEEASGANSVYRFCSPATVNMNRGLIEKLRGYARFCAYTNAVLRKNDYDYVVLLQTLAGMVTSRTLLTKYPGRYVLDIRDYTYERNKVFYLLEKELIRRSKFTVISSEGYRSFLPSEYEYVVCHNSRALGNEEAIRAIRTRVKKTERINIAFIGYVSYQEQHRRLLLRLKNHPQLHLSFIGKEANRLQAFCVENGVHNVTIVDKFHPDEILDFYVGVDLVNNLYGHGTPRLDHALSNKLYFAAQLHIPILVCPGTYMAEIAKRYHFGIEVDVDDPMLADVILDSYSSLDWGLLSRGCNAFMEKVEAENEAFARKVRSLITSVRKGNGV